MTITEQENLPRDKDSQILDTLTKLSKEPLKALADTNFHKFVTKQRWSNEQLTVGTTIDRLQGIEGTEKWIEPLQKIDANEPLQVVVSWLYVMTGR